VNGKASVQRTGSSGSATASAKMLKKSKAKTVTSDYRVVRPAGDSDKNGDGDGGQKQGDEIDRAEHLFRRGSTVVSPNVHVALNADTNFT
jgi:alkylated DNA nucleotide flippase Atl1